MAPYFGSIEYMRAKDFRTFIGALNRWGAPSENQVYADIEGNIGYKPAGRFPNRPNWDGLLPAPGDGTYEWDGFFDMDVLPEEYNPHRGFTGTANALSLPADYPIENIKLASNGRRRGDTSVCGRFWRDNLSIPFRTRYLCRPIIFYSWKVICNYLPKQNMSA